MSLTIEKVNQHYSDGNLTLNEAVGKLLELLADTNLNTAFESMQSELIDALFKHRLVTNPPKTHEDILMLRSWCGVDLPPDPGPKKIRIFRTIQKLLDYKEDTNGG